MNNEITQTLLEQLNDAALICDKKKNIIMVNKAAETLLNSLSDKIIGKNYNQIFNDSEYNSLLLLEDKITGFSIFKIYRKDYKYIEISNIDNINYNDLKDKLNRYDLILKAADKLGICIAIYQDEGDKKGVIKEINDAGLALSGYTREEIINQKGVFEIFEVQDFDTIFNRYLNRLEGKEQPSYYELVLKNKYKNVIHLLTMVQRIIYNGRPAIIGFFMDISIQKKFQKEIEEINEKLIELINSMPDTVCFKDSEGKWILANEAILKLFDLIGVSYQGKTNHELSDMSDPLYKDIFVNFEKYDKLSLETGQLIREIQTMNIKNEGIKYFDIINKPLIKPDGTRKGIINVGRDITEFKLIQEALEAEKERLSITLESIGEAVIATDKDGYILIFNKTAQAITGWKENEAIGRYISDVFNFSNESNGNKNHNPLEIILKDSKKLMNANHINIISKDEEKIPISISGSPIKNKNDETIGAVLAFRDIRDKIKNEQEQMKFAKLESLSQLAGGIAHDFNNLLTSIMGSISLTKYKLGDKSSVSSYLDPAENAINVAINLTKQLLTFSKGGAPVLKVSSMKDIIEESVSFSVRGSNIDLSMYIDKDLYNVNVDPAQIAQVINNIIINSIEAMPDGGKIFVDARNIYISSDDKYLPLKSDNYIKVTIKDTGVGIHKNILPHIFDPYFTTKPKGSGLGLATCYSIITKHGGWITVNSTEGSGTEVIFFLPIVKDKHIENNKIQNFQEIPLKGHGRILFMDDDPLIRNIVIIALSEMGFEVEMAQNGEEAIYKYKDSLNNNKLFDIVIIDLTIRGGMGGEETIKELQKLNPKIKAIVCSGYSDKAIISNYKDYGFNAALVKPYEINDLVDKINSIIKMNN